jgi:hypothetical protein
MLRWPIARAPSAPRCIRLTDDTTVLRATAAGCLCQAPTMQQQTTVSAGLINDIPQPLAKNQKLKSFTSFRKVQDHRRLVAGSAIIVHMDELDPRSHNFMYRSNTYLRNLSAHGPRPPCCHQPVALPLYRHARFVTCSPLPRHRALCRAGVLPKCGRGGTGRRASLRC